MNVCVAVVDIVVASTALDKSRILPSASFCNVN
jgi:hypothetical protein